MIPLPFRLLARPSLLGLSLTLGGCIVMPRTEMHYDDACDVEYKHITLTAEQVNLASASMQCDSRECAIVLAAQLLAIPVSALISGSIVLVGNTMYWAQHKGACMRAPEPVNPEVPLIPPTSPGGATPTSNAAPQS